MLKKNKPATYTPTTPNMDISKNRFVSILIGSIIATAVTTAFTVGSALFRVANSDHFAIVATEQRLDTLEENIVPRTEFARFEVDLNKRLDRIDAKLDRLQ